MRKSVKLVPNFCKNCFILRHQHQLAIRRIDAGAMANILTIMVLNRQIYGSKLSNNKGISIFMFVMPLV